MIKVKKLKIVNLGEVLCNFTTILLSILQKLPVLKLVYIGLEYLIKFKNFVQNFDLKNLKRNYISAIRKVNMESLK